MNKLLLISLLLLIVVKAPAQCLSQRGIRCDGYSILQDISYPATDVSIGVGLFEPNTFKNILKIDIFRICQNKIVYGCSLGVRPLKLFTAGTYEKGLASGFIGYNLANCIIVGGSFGFTCTTTTSISTDVISTKIGYKPDIGMAIKFITTYTKTPIIIGGYGSSSGIGITVGTFL